MSRFFTGLALGFVLFAALLTGAAADRIYGIDFLDRFFSRNGSFRFATGEIEQKVLKEESVVIDVVERVSASVVTVSVETPTRRVLEFDPFGGGFNSRFEGGTPQDIGSGFIVSSDGLIVTNKHVVSSDSADYKVVLADGSEHEVKEISRDPSNDIAILKIDANNLTPVELGDSDNLKVGQFVIAIGTALGEFRSTVTTGVISGLGRGITAGSSFQGFVERLDDVIQTDAAINPGNSGGPLLNSAGQVIGVNVAVAAGAENIGFAIPISVVKDGLDQFKTTGKFASRPYLGVQYQMVPKRTAILNNVPQGAYVLGVMSDSPAQAAGIAVDDIITKIDGVELTDENALADVIAGKRVGDTVNLEVWRAGETRNITAVLSEFSQ